MTAPVLLPGSKDDLTGEIYVPARKFAADGSLRECSPVEVEARGVLASWTRYRDENYGLVDLANSVRIQVLLGDGPHVIGAGYVGQRTEGTDEVRFFNA